MEIRSEIIPIFKNLKGIYKIILFGSRVNNPTKERGDIDLCFIIDDDFNSEDIIEKAGNVLAEHKVIIHPLIFKKSEFELKMKINIYKKSILEKGRLLYKRKTIK